MAPDWINVLNASASSTSPSRMSMARRDVPIEAGASVARSVHEHWIARWIPSFTPIIFSNRREPMLSPLFLISPATARVAHVEDESRELAVELLLVGDVELQ